MMFPTAAPALSIDQQICDAYDQKRWEQMTPATAHTFRSPLVPTLRGESLSSLVSKSAMRLLTRSGAWAMPLPSGWVPGAGTALFNDALQFIANNANCISREIADASISAMFSMGAMSDLRSSYFYAPMLDRWNTRKWISTNQTGRLA